ncbi:MAG: hypothetical protein WC247_15455, partial [Porticoccaceae bacterium]
LTAAAIHTGKVYVDDTWSTGGTNTQHAPDWTRIDLGARYRLHLADKPVTLRATVENALDENYWTVSTFGNAQLGWPRIVVLSATVDF